MLLKKMGLICIFSIVSFYSHADIMTAYQAAQNKDYATASEHFQLSANLGHAKAQNILAQLLSHGAGIDKDPILAYVYFALANEQLQTKKSQQAAIAALSRLNDADKKLAETKLIEYQKSIGKSALAKDILPIIASKPFVLSPAKKIASSKVVSGSEFTVKKIDLSSSILEYDIAPDGSVRDVAVAYSYFANSKLLQDMVRSTYRLKFATKNTPRYQDNNIQDQRSIWAQRTLNKEAIKELSRDFYKRIIQLERLAQEGNANAQYELAMYIIAFPALSTNQSVAVDYIKKAAKSGHSKAAAEYAYYLFKGKGVKQDFAKGVTFLVNAAQGADSRGQYRLAREFLSGNIIQKDTEKALFWLKQAAKAGDKNAEFWLARTLLEQTTSAPEDLEQAYELLNKTKKPQEANPNWYYALSKFHLKKNDNASAMTILIEAISLAQDLKWQIADWQSELALLRNP
jgi:TPR repeat protein